MDYAIGIDLGGTNIKLLAVKPSGDIIASKSTPTLDDGTPSWTLRVANELLNFEKELKSPATYVGLSAPGMTNSSNSAIISLPGRLHGLENLIWSDFLKRPVPVLNDAHAALYGEAWKGAASNYKNAIFLTLGTGVGGAFLINGTLQKGSTGRAGHFGHTTVLPDLPLDIKNAPGSIEDAIGECTVKKRSHGRFQSTEELLKAYRTHDPLAQLVWLRSVYLLACSIISSINILDPEIILIGGGISQAGDDLLIPLRSYMDILEWRPQGHRVPVMLAQLGNNAGGLGAARFALENASK